MKLRYLVGALLALTMIGHAATAVAQTKARMQTAVPSASIYFELLKRYADRVDKMSKVTYFTMGSNKWQTSDVWPPANAQPMTLHL